MKKYILFDLDGTLVNTGEGIVKSVYYALERLGICEEETEKLERFIGPPLSDSFRDFYQLNETGVKKAIEKYRERYNKKGMQESKVYDGIPELLQTLKETGHVLCVATSKPGVFAEKIIDLHQIKQYFDFLSCATLDGTLSAKKDIIQIVLDRYPDASKEEFIMVGDREHDIFGAKACGIESIGVRYGFAVPGEFEAAGADYIFNTVKDLQGFLLSNI